MRVTHICFKGVLFCTEERPHIGAMYVRVNTGATVRRHACPECLKKLPEALYDSVIMDAAAFGRLIEDFDIPEKGD